MEIRQLRYFLVVAEEENFHRAALRLHVAQSALTRRIQDLEKSLGVALFERAKKRIQLSGPGRALVESARKILLEVERAETRVRLTAEGIEGILRVGFHQSTSLQKVVPDSFRNFRSAFRQARLALSPLPSVVSGPDSILSGELDACYLLEWPLDRNQLQTIHVASSDLCVGLPADHRLAKRKRLRLADLRNENLFFFPRALNPELYDRVLAACHAGGLQPDMAEPVPSEAMRLSLVAAGVGVTFARACFNEYPRSNVVLRPVVDLRVPVRTELVWHRENTSPLLLHFIRIVREMAAGRR